LPVNEAIERAHRDGILSTTSLMVAGDAAADAVERARRLPSLRVGLHLVLVRGRPVLPPDRIPDLVGPDGDFSTRLVRAGFRYFFLPSVRAQLAAEIRAQFERFHDSGLPLDHVNSHNHMHLHPTILGLILEIGRDFGLRAVRLPHEPFQASWKSAHRGFLRRLANDLLLRVLIASHRRRMTRAGVAFNDYVFGMNDTGAMDRERMLAILANLPDGVSEIYCHPATGPWSGMEPEARSYRVADELAALTDEAVRSTLRSQRIEPTAFSLLA
jgi:hopanoid biosynthesis associated protein HpnK